MAAIRHVRSSQPVVIRQVAHYAVKGRVKPPPAFCACEALLKHYSVPFLSRDRLSSSWW